MIDLSAARADLKESQFQKKHERIQNGNSGCSFYAVGETAALRRSRQFRAGENLMKTPLAAVSLFVTWYLITPPWPQVGKFDTQAPLSKWNKITLYPSSAACEADRQIMVKAIAPENQKFMVAAQCVAEGDPRFKQ
jgi:hypothetical protein